MFNGDWKQYYGYTLALILISRTVFLEMNQLLPYCSCYWISTKSRLRWLRGFTVTTTIYHISTLPLEMFLCLAQSYRVPQSRHVRGIAPGLAWGMPPNWWRRPAGYCLRRWCSGVWCSGVWCPSNDLDHVQVRMVTMLTGCENMEAATKAKGA